MQDKDTRSRKGRQIAVLIAGVGVSYVLITSIGASVGLSNRTLAFFDLAALAGFAFAIWMIYGLWRDGRNNKD